MRSWLWGVFGGDGAHWRANCSCRRRSVQQLPPSSRPRHSGRPHPAQAGDRRGTACSTLHPTGVAASSTDRESITMPWEIRGSSAISPPTSPHPQDTPRAPPLLNKRLRASGRRAGAPPAVFRQPFLAFRNGSRWGFGRGGGQFLSPEGRPDLYGELSSLRRGLLRL